MLFRSTMTFTHRANDPANSYGYDTLDRLTGVEYLSDAQDIEDFSAMDNLGNRTGTITQRDGVRDYTTDALTNRCRSQKNQCKDSKLATERLRRGLIFLFLSIGF